MNICQLEPKNEEEIKKICIMDKDLVVEKVLTANTIYIYDTCSIIHHSKLDNVDYIVELIKRHKGIVLITWTVLMELSNGKILDKHLMFLQNIKELGVDLVLFQEEFTYDCIRAAYSYSIEEVNQQLKYGICFMKKLQGTIARYIDGLDTDYRGRLLRVDSDKEEIRSFFKKIRCNKVSKDSLAEELIFIVIILLQGIVGDVVFISDDFKSSDKFLRMTDYISEQYGRKRISMYTTAVLLYKLVREELAVPEEGRRILECSYPDKIKLYATDRYDLRIEKKEVSVEQYIYLLETDKEFRVYR